MNLEIASSVALILAAVFNILPFVMKLYDRIKAKRLRFQRLFIYAQLAEKFVQWYSMGSLLYPIKSNYKK